MSTNIQRSEAENAYLDAFATAEEALPSAAWLAPMRTAARERFAETGLPHRRMEAWRWTDLRTMLDRGFPPALAEREDGLGAAARDTAFTALDRHVITFVDGYFRADLSDFEGLGSEAECIVLGAGLAAAPDWLKDTFGQAFPDTEDTLSELNTAFLTGGIAIAVPAGKKIAKPVELVYANTGTEPETLNTRCLVHVGEGAEVTILDSHMGKGDGRYVANTWTEVFIAAGGRAHHIKVQAEGPEAVHLANLHAVVGADAEFRAFCLNVGSQATRNQIQVRLEGEGGDTSIASAYVLSQRQHCDTALLVDHAVANCTSNELFKCVMDDRSRGIFQGKIIVRRDAQHTDGMQMSQALLLSETAEFDAKPELEIFADDVRCTHGATSGELDEDLMFYLRSRGIPADQAKSLLIGAFVGEAIEDIESEEIRDLLNGFVARVRGVARESL